MVILNDNFHNINDSCRFPHIIIYLENIKPREYNYLNS